jgi:hypothetical protein
LQNKASDSLATFGRVEGRTLTWIGSDPPEVLEIVENDCKDLIIEQCNYFPRKKKDRDDPGMQVFGVPFSSTPSSADICCRCSIILFRNGVDIMMEVAL